VSAKEKELVKVADSGAVSVRVRMNPASESEEIMTSTVSMMKSEVLRSQSMTWMEVVPLHEKLLPPMAMMPAEEQLMRVEEETMPKDWVGPWAMLNPVTSTV